MSSPFDPFLNPPPPKPFSFGEAFGVFPKLPEPNPLSFAGALGLPEALTKMPPQWSSAPPPTMAVPDRRTVFVSHSHLHESETKQFFREFAGVFIPRSIGISDKDDFIDSDDPAYVMRRIREKHIGPNSIVTIVLVGSCTHSRKYVDWEIKASLQQGLDKRPNGVLAIQLPSCPNGALLPPRLEANWRRNDHVGYARYYQYPRTKDELRRWIEEAAAARKTIADRVVNPNEMMRYNAKCRSCGITH